MNTVYGFVHCFVNQQYSVKRPQIVLLLMLISTGIFGQDAKVYKSWQANKMCSSTITLLKGGNFVFEQGCEESSNTCFGKWHKTGNTIQLVPEERKDFVIVKYFEAGPAKDGIAKLKVLDNMGQDMTAKMKFTLLDTLHKEVANTDNWAEAAKAPFIRLTTLKNIFNVGIDIDNSGPRNNIIQLNIPSQYIENKNSVWQLPASLTYSIDANCLVENIPQGKGVKYCP